MHQPLPKTSTEINTETSEDIYINQKQESLLSEKDTDLNKVPYDEIFNIFNQTCVSLPKVIKLTSVRCAQIKARWKEYNSIGTFIKVFKMAEESDFLSGKNNKWAGCCFDWLMQKDKFIQVLEGNYRNIQGSNNFKPRDNAVEYYKELEKVTQQRLIGEDNENADMEETVDNKAIIENMKNKARNG
ncbi:hypothetical protein [Clostridium ljungdahlii]|uniref:hypothetical protein n=1 Tax=Clostridium ljungdahlii TaxID=1538 RepID=UPI0007BECADA|nr:hypothetical protein [Clostridium ljungdahlii]